jgi:hypothetical protein
VCAHMGWGVAGVCVCVRTRTPIAWVVRRCVPECVCACGGECVCAHGAVRSRSVCVRTHTHPNCVGVLRRCSESEVNLSAQYHGAHSNICFL